MMKKVILLVIISSILLCGFAQKTKKKSTTKSPKSEYFIMLMDGKETPEKRYCPGDSIEFAFIFSGDSIENFTFYWVNNSYSYYIFDTIYDTTPIKLAFPDIHSDYKVSLYFTIFTEIDTVFIRDTLSTFINVDYIRTILDTTVCRGRDITVTITYPDKPSVDTTFINVQGDRTTPDIKFPTDSGCDSLVRWYIHMNPYIEEKHEISSCDSVTWGHIIVKRPLDYEGDYPETIDSVFRVEYPPNYCCDCDTLKSLEVTIIDTPYLKIVFDQQAFCNGDDMGGFIELETNFTAFNWTYKDVDKDSLWTEFIKSIEIEHSGWYFVHAYMDTSLYDTLKDLRIVNCFLEADTLVEDCDLIIPNVITPDGDNTNDILGIKKLNPKRPNELTIYDRWGKTVFHQKNYKCVFKSQKYENDEDAFAGISNWGQPLPDGTYYYAFKYAAIPKTKKYTGTIVILRKK